MKTFTVELPGTTLNLQYDKKVYSPEYTSLGSVLIATKLIQDAGKVDMKILDVGCGTGILGLSIKKLNPFADVTLCDIDKRAVEVARLNAKRFNVAVIQCDLLPKLSEYDIIVANLPTFDKGQMKTEELHGPKIAYKGKIDPLNLYQKLFHDARLKTRVLICECQPKYQVEFQLLALKENWELIMDSGDCFAFWQKLS